MHRWNVISSQNEFTKCVLFSLPVLALAAQERTSAWTGYCRKLLQGTMLTSWHVWIRFAKAGSIWCRMWYVVTIIILSIFTYVIRAYLCQNKLIKTCSNLHLILSILSFMLFSPFSFSTSSCIMLCLKASSLATLCLQRDSCVQTNHWKILTSKSNWR